MSTLNWQADYNINVTQIDEQHRQMLDIALDLHTAVTERRSTATLIKKFDTLADYTRKHFAFEETLMLEYQYPGLEAHRHEHANLLHHLEMFRRGLESGKLLQLSPSVTVDGDWVLTHVAGADRELGEFLNQQGLL